MLAAFFLSKYGISEPPEEIKANSWNQAYNIFYESLSQGRSETEFYNSLRLTRHEFDGEVSETRIGFQRPLGEQHKETIQQWGESARIEIWNHLENLIQNSDMVRSVEDVGAMVEADGDVVVSDLEGAVKYRVMMSRERNPKLRRRAVEIHGLNCTVCGFNFEEYYGAWGRGFIEIHHLKMIAEYGEGGSETNPETDLIPLCSNCHRMVHRRSGLVLTSDELAERISKARDSET